MGSTRHCILRYSRTPLIRPPSESHWCGRIRGMVTREGFVYEQKPLSVTRNVVVWEGWLFVRGSTVHLYYYSSPVITNLSSKFDENFPVRSQFYSDHRVNCLRQSATFVRPLFAFVICFLQQKIIKKNTNLCGESVSIGVIDQVRSANVDPKALLQINR